MLSPRLKTLADSPTLWINQESKRLTSLGRKVIKLGFGQSPFPVPASVVESLRKNAFQKDYLPGKGLYPLRNAIANYCKRRLGLDLSPEQISIGPGTKELIFGLQMAFDGDLILPSPSWVSYAPQAEMLGKKAWWVNTSEENNWLVEADDLDEVCSQIENPNKLLILNYPNNPTGTSYSAAQIRALVPVLQKHKVLLIADEIYNELHFAGAKESFAQYYPEGTIISSGLSKWCGAGGWRLGFFAFPDRYRQLQDTMAAIASETFSAVSAPVQWAAITAYEGGEEIDIYLKKSSAILKAIAEYVRQELLKLEISMPAGQGGFYLFPNFENHRAKLLNKGIGTSTDLCNHLLNDLGIALLPGAAFGRPADELSVRLSFVDFDGEAALNNLGAAEQKIDAAYLDRTIPQIKLAIELLAGWIKE